ncbi:MAG: YdeI/OmpD-associated family protein [Rubrivivax sp.]|nr:YdeI/OmpD-associated family protein [Pyrinomonadaceae bacterium]
MKQNPKYLYVADRAEWRAWLEENHARETEVWLISYKKHTGRPSVPYNDAVEEALCFGWIDSIARRLDDERYVQKYTPRKDTSNWSESNRRRLKRLVEAGKMTSAGMLKVGGGVLDAPLEEPGTKKKEVEVPQFFKDALMKKRKAWDNFNGLAPSYRREYVAWVADAKREQTRARRLEEAVRLLTENKKLGMK